MKPEVTLEIMRLAKELGMSVEEFLRPDTPETIRNIAKSECGWGKNAKTFLSKKK